MRINNAYEKIVEYAHACYYLQVCCDQQYIVQSGGKKDDFESDTSNTIEGLKGISRVDFCVLDTEGKELAATFDMAKIVGKRFFLLLNHRQTVR